MGSLTSGPKVSSSPQVVYVSQPSATTVSTNTASENTTPEADAEETSAEVRKQSLLERERSRFGTIQTGFRGLLGLSDNSGQRKTLLGE